MLFIILSPVAGVNASLSAVVNVFSLKPLVVVPVNLKSAVVVVHDTVRFQVIVWLPAHVLDQALSTI